MTDAIATHLPSSSYLERLRADMRAADRTVLLVDARAEPHRVRSVGNRASGRLTDGGAAQLPPVASPVVVVMAGAPGGVGSVRTSASP
jgi:hypothetical protein